MSTISINGQHFNTGTAWQATEVQLAFADPDGSNEVYDTLAYKDESFVSPGLTIVQWTDTLIELTLTDHQDKYLSRALVHNADRSQTAEVNIEPNVPADGSTPPVDSLYVSYDDSNDFFTIQTGSTSMADVTQINYTGSNGTGQLQLGVHFDVLSPYQIRVHDAFLYLNGPTTITHLDLFDGSNVLVIGGDVAQDVHHLAHIDLVEYTAADTIHITGQHLDLADAFGLDGHPYVGGGSYNYTVYDPNGPNGHFNDNDLVITITDTLVSVQHPSLVDKILDDVQARDTTGSGIAIWYGPTHFPQPGDYPDIQAGYSPATNRIVLTGLRFETATLGAIHNLTLRFADPNNDGRLNTFYRPPAGHPGNLANQPNDPQVTIIEWSDERIELTDTRFASVGADPNYDQDMPFVVTGVALADETSLNYYYLEDPVDNGPFPVDGTTFPPERTGTITDVAVDGDSGTEDQVLIHGTGLTDTSSVGLNINEPQIRYYYADDSPNVGLNPPGSQLSKFSDTEIRVTDPYINEKQLNQVEASNVVGLFNPPDAPLAIGKKTPTIFGWDSPNPNEVRISGSNLSSIASVQFDDIGIQFDDQSALQHSPNQPSSTVTFGDSEITMHDATYLTTGTVVDSAYINDFLGQPFVTLGQPETFPPVTIS